MKFAELLSMIVPLVAFLLYLALLFLGVKNIKLKTSRLFIAYLVLMMIWCMGSFMMRTGLFPGTLFWNRFMLIGICWIPVVFFNYTYRQIGWNNLNIFIITGYVISAFFCACNFFGYIVTNAYMSGGLFVYSLGPMAGVFAVTTIVFVVFAIFLLVVKARRNPLYFWYNHLHYPAIGIVIILLASLLNFVPSIGQYPVDIAAVALNAFLLAYSIPRLRFRSMKLTLRKGLVYTLSTLLITGGFIVIILLLQRFTEIQASFCTLVLAFAMAFVIALLFDQGKNRLRLSVEKAFGGQQYDFRKTLKEFSHLMTSILDIDELAGSTLDLLAKAMQLKSCSLFLKDRGGNFYNHRQKNQSPDYSIMIDKNSPIIRWLDRKDEGILYANEIKIHPVFSGLWQKEIDYLHKLDASLLLGIKMNKELIGFFLLSGKISGEQFTNDDLELLFTLSNEAAVAINNAQAYHEVKFQAVRDELTKLYNYRYFHEFLDKEIARCKRNGCFALVLMDLDFFKVYNDIYGHLAGDEAIADVAGAIFDSIRISDVAARYGGDEFAVILPDIDEAGALAAAERIRVNVQNIFSGTSHDNKILTVSLGVACFPGHTDSKQQLLSYADQALYQAKNIGKNNVCIYNSDYKLSEKKVVRTEKTANDETDFLKKQVEDAYLSTVYTLAAVINARDNYTYKHSEMVKVYAVALGEKLNLSEERKKMIRLAAMLHDIGKIGIPEYILNKPGPLTPDEQEIIHRHVNIAEAIVNQMPYLRRVAPIILHHHEAYDGSGYPYGQKGEDIPLESRIITLADVYHAITSDRPYRKAMSREDALKLINDLSGKIFDPGLVPHFIKMIENESVKFTVV